VTYEIDLSTKECDKHRAAFEHWIEAGRRVGDGAEARRQRKQDSDRATIVRSNPRVGPVSTVMR